MIYLLYIKSYVQPDNPFVPISKENVNFTFWCAYNSATHRRTVLVDDIEQIFSIPIEADLPTLDSAIAHLCDACCGRPPSTIGVINLSTDYPEYLL